MNIQEIKKNTMKKIPFPEATTGWFSGERLGAACLKKIVDLVAIFELS
jgi:hypothetical protein